MHCQVHVRKSRAAMQRSKAAAVVSGDVGSAEAPAIPAIPGMDRVARSKLQPAHRAPAPAETEAKTTAEPEEGNISRRPNRLVERVTVGRTRPPSPTSVDIHPAAVVIRRPAPIV